jgi:hypothetical protein
MLAGKSAVIGETSNTDPFMTLVTPVERYVTHSCFGTAIMSAAQGVNNSHLLQCYGTNYVSTVCCAGNNPSLFFDARKTRVVMGDDVLRHTT